MRKRLNLFAILSKKSPRQEFKSSPLKASVVLWVERYLYNPNFFQKLLSYFLLPLSYLYCFLAYIRFNMSKEQDLGIKIVGVGNLSVGGSGKTPLVSALASKYEKSAIVLRGYGRQSRGLQVVKNREKILCDVSVSGDEAMIYARHLPKAIVIVSEDRVEGIQKAKEMGAKIVFLDDAYSKHFIKKLDIVIDIKSENRACLPSGPYRERLWSTKEAIVIKEEREFGRVVKIKQSMQKMSLVTAIARPERLNEFLPEVLSKNYFEDHHSFTKEELLSILERDKSQSLLVTYKDYVKIESFGIPLSLLDLELTLSPDFVAKVDEYISQKV